MPQLTALVPQYRLFDSVRVRESIAHFGGMVGLVMRVRANGDGSTTYAVSLTDREFMRRCQVTAVEFEETELEAM